MEGFAMRARERKREMDKKIKLNIILEEWNGRMIEMVYGEILTPYAYHFMRTYNRNKKWTILLTYALCPRFRGKFVVILSSATS